MLLPAMESRDLVSVSRHVFASHCLEGFKSRLGLEGDIFASHGFESFRFCLGFEGDRSRDFEYCKEMV